MAWLDPGVDCNDDVGVLSGFGACGDEMVVGLGLVGMRWQWGCRSSQWGWGLWEGGGSGVGDCGDEVMVGLGLVGWRWQWGWGLWG